MDKPNNNNRRAPVERSDSGEIPRRHFKFAVKLSTSMNFETVEAWLDRNCTEPWDLAFEGIDDDLTKKSFTVRFLNEDDKKQFVANFSPRRR